MKSGTHDGRYHLRFKVYDRKHTQTDVPANVTVTVKTIPHEAVLNSGSVRISGITDEDFIRIWDYKVYEEGLEIRDDFSSTRFDFCSSRKLRREVKRNYSGTNWRTC